MTRGPAPTLWTQERRGLLRVLWRHGMERSLIAKRLGLHGCAKRTIQNAVNNFCTREDKAVRAGKRSGMVRRRASFGVLSQESRRLIPPEISLTYQEAQEAVRETPLPPGHPLTVQAAPHLFRRIS